MAKNQVANFLAIDGVEVVGAVDTDRGGSMSSPIISTSKNASARSTRRSPGANSMQPQM